MQYHVILAYSRTDAATMQRVRATLTAARLTVWTDERLLPGSEAWSQAYEGAIDNAGCVVVLLSPDTKDAHWVKQLTDYARDENKAIFPILLRGDGKILIPADLTNAPRASLESSYDGEMQKLVSAIREYITSIQADTIPNRPTQMLKVPRPRPAAKTRWRLIAAIGGGILVLVLLAVLLLNNRRNAEVAVPSLTPAVAVFTNTPAPTDAPQPTATASDTPPPTETPTATSSPTPATPVAQPIRDIIARDGPGSQYPEAGTVQADSRVTILGISEDGEWLLVQLEDGIAAWIIGSTLVVAQAGDLHDVPIIILPSDTPTRTPTPTATRTPIPTATASRTPTSSPTPRPTHMSTATTRPSHTSRPTRTSTSTRTPTPTATATRTVTFTATPTPSRTLSATVRPSNTPLPTATPTPEPLGKFPYFNNFEGANALVGWDYDSALWEMADDPERGPVLVGLSSNGSSLDSPIVILGEATPDWLAADDLVIHFDFNIQSASDSSGARLIFRASDDGYYALEFFQGTATLRQGNTAINETMLREDEPVLRTNNLPLENNEWHQVTLWLDEQRLYLYVDGRALEPVNTLRLPAGAIGLQVVGSRPVAFDNLRIEQPGAATHFDGEVLPNSWFTEGVGSSGIRSEPEGNRYLWMGASTDVQPQNPTLVSPEIHCRVWNEKGSYTIRLFTYDGGGLEIIYDVFGSLNARLLSNTGNPIWTSDTVRNFHGRGAWVDVGIMLDFSVRHLSVYANGTLRLDTDLPTALGGKQIVFVTAADSAIRLDDCVFLN